MFRPLGVIFRLSLGTYFTSVFVLLFFICIRDPLCITSEISKDGTQLFSTVSTYDYKYFIAVAEVHVAGPYSWVASGGGLLYCVFFPSLLLFLCFTGFQVGYSGGVSCSSQLVFEVFIGVHRLTRNA